MFRKPSSISSRAFSAPLLLVMAAIATIAFPDDMSAQRKIVRRSSPIATHYVRTSVQSTATSVYEYDYVEIQPNFPGGEVQMLHYINSERRYPADAYRRRIQGRVVCDFIVLPDGSISDVRVIKGVEASLDREAVRIISGMPRWDAGRMGQEAVPVRCLLPIPFRL